MKKRQAAALCRKISQGLPGSSCKDAMIFEIPVGHILRGFGFEGSDFNPDNFVVTAFAIPLYVPTTHIYFNFGSRLVDEKGCDKWWSLRDSDVYSGLLHDIQQARHSRIGSARDADAMVTLIEGLPGMSSPHSLEALAYSHVMANRFQPARQALDRLMNELDRTIAWQAEVGSRAAQILRQLDDDPQKAVCQLRQWEQFSIEQLGIEESVL